MRKGCDEEWNGKNEEKVEKNCENSRPLTSLPVDCLGQRPTATPTTCAKMKMTSKMKMT